MIMDPFHGRESIYLDLKKGRLVFYPRTGSQVFQIHSVIYCRCRRMWHLIFTRFQGILMTDKRVIRIDLPSVRSRNQTVHLFEVHKSEYLMEPDYSYLLMYYRIINYSNQSDEDQIDDQDVRGVNLGTIRINWDGLKSIWKQIKNKIRRDRIAIEEHQF